MIWTICYLLSLVLYGEFWAVFVRMLKDPAEQPMVNFAMAQEAVCEDIERAFGALVARFPFFKGRPACGTKMAL